MQVQTSATTVEPILFLQYIGSDTIELTLDAIVSLQSSTQRAVEAIGFIGSHTADDCETVQQLVHHMYKTDIDMSQVNKPGVWMFMFDRDDASNDLVMIFVMRLVNLREVNSNNSIAMNVMMCLTRVTVLIM